MHPLPVFNVHLAVLTALLIIPVIGAPGIKTKTPEPTIPSQHATPFVCNCTITQSGNTYPISALMGTESAVAFYDYGNPNGSSANTGLELPDALILFLYEDLNTGIISLFLIADIANSGTGGTMTFEANCLPASAYVSVQDDAGEFFGAPPLITGNWSWSSCCTDGGVIEDIGCSNSINLDLLVSSGLDSIVWLTGDIANPTQILLGLTGEAITINCGGGVCCPVGFDTEIVVTDASCPDTPDGVISLSPQDGLPAYSYNWSNGGSMSTNSNLLPGTYMVTVTDAQGCYEELEISVGFSPGEPPAQPASIELCSVNATDYFDLTSVNEIVNLGSGFVVLWFENADLTGDIADPSAYLSGTNTVYAVVDNGFCLSDPVPVILSLLVEPVANTASINACEDNNEMAYFDLTTLEFIINGGIGAVVWYHDILLTDEINDPEEFLSESTTVYAVIVDGPCASQPVEIELFVDLKPIGDEAEMQLCGDVNNEAIFDLIQLEISITGGNGSVQWYLEFELLDPINSPGNFQTTTTTVYAVIFDGICYSNGIPVDLVVELTPTGNPVTATMCGNANGEALFNLWDYAGQVSGGTGAVEWFLDNELLDPITNPEFFLSESTIVFATIDNGTCFSEPVPVTINVVDGLIGIPTSLQTCADMSGQGVFDLTSVDTVVSGGTGTVQWYNDPQGTDLIINPSQYQTSGTTVYALITDGACQSDFTPVNLVIINAVTATPAQAALCDEGSGIAVFNLTSIENIISGGVGQVNWFFDPSATLTIPAPNVFSSSSTTVFANVTAGSCISGIVPVELLVLPTPTSMNLTIDLCGNAVGETSVDLTLFEIQISGGTGNVSWFGDAGLNMPINNPSSFFTGDTSLYAVATNTNCSSPPAQILINVSQQLTANPFSVELCKDQGESIVIDLTAYNQDISSGLQVTWFTDASGINEITTPEALTAAASQLIYANVSDDMCTSPLVPVNIMIMDWPVANPFAVKKCGDSNGQITFDLTTVESFVSENTGIVSWYADIMLTTEIINATSFVSGDTVVYAFVTNGFCFSGPVPVTLEIVDSLVANTTSLEACATQNDSALINLTLSEFDISGSNGSVYWFSDGSGLDTIFNPTNFMTGTNSVFAIVAADGCISNLVEIPIEVFNPPLPPIADCDSSEYSSITFSWVSNAPEVGYEYLINNTVQAGPFETGSTSVLVDALNGGDEVTLSIWSIGLPPCGNSDTLSITCFAKQCPDANLYIIDTGFFCSNADPALLAVMLDGLSANSIITWSGDGIIDPSGLFDAGLVGPGAHQVNVNVNDGGCIYSSSNDVLVTKAPEADFIINGVPCLDSTLFIEFSGYAFASSIWNWDLGEANVSPGPRPVDFYVNWDEPGLYELSLWILARDGCISDTFNLPVEIEAPLSPPVITCLEEDYYSILVSWEPVNGATEYIVSTSEGDGKQSGNTYAISNLPDNTAISITVTATGSVCGPISTTIECQTPEFIPLKYFIPDIFSPDGDGINDIFFIQSNSQVTEVNTFRIFDRWGNLVFEDLLFPTNDPTHGWDGAFSGKPMNPEVYLYWAEMKTADGDVLVVAGDLTLIR